MGCRWSFRHQHPIILTFTLRKHCIAFNFLVMSYPERDGFVGQTLSHECDKRHIENIIAEQWTAILSKLHWYRLIKTELLWHLRWLHVSFIFHWLQNIAVTTLACHYNISDLFSAHLYEKYSHHFGGVFARSLLGQCLMKGNKTIWGKKNHKSFRFRNIHFLIEIPETNEPNN